MFQTSTTVDSLNQTYMVHLAYEMTSTTGRLAQRLAKLILIPTSEKECVHVLYRAFEVEY